jgi:hypothetical protein
MSLQRIILFGKTTTDLLNNIQFELSKINSTVRVTGTTYIGTNFAAAANRTKSTLYTNNGVGPMLIGISLSLSSPGTQGAKIQVGGVDVVRVDGTADKYFFIMGIANPGQQYLLTATGGVDIKCWNEYGF